MGSTASSLSQESKSGETRQEYENRMARWAKEDAAAKNAGKLRPINSLPKTVSSPLDPSVDECPDFSPDREIEFAKFAKGWKEGTIGISVLDGDTHNILFFILEGSYSRWGWRLAKWLHRSIAIAAFILGFMYSWFWLLLLVLAIMVRSGFYNAARQEIGRLCAENYEIYAKVSGLGDVLRFVRR